MSKLRGANVSDEHIRQYIKTQAAKKGEGSDVSVEHLRKTFGIGYKRAKRLHDDELGPTNPDAYRSGRKATPKRDADAVSDEAAMEFIQKCRDEGRDISTNELRHELHIGYKRAVRLLTQGDQPVRTTRSPTSKKRTSMTLGAINLGFGEGDAANAIDELAGLHPISPNKRARRERKSEEVDESEEGEEDDGSRDDDEGLEEAKALETLDEGRVVDTNGDGLLEFTDVVLNLPKGVGWDTLQAFEYKEK